MPEYDPARDDDTKIISISPSGEIDESTMVILPDGTKQVTMGSGIITGILGEGGMSIIYEIWNEQLGVKRAVKLLRPNSSKENKERFEKEMKVTAQLDHPNIIDIHAVGEWNSLPYIEMEMVSGISLEELIRRQGALPLLVCTSIGIIVCRALDYTHHHEYRINDDTFKGLLHGDLKPGNILFSREGVIRLTDFGVATPTEVPKSSSNGKVMGSMQYLSPEQMEEGDVDIRADIFSFGCIFYEMFTGERTFPERNITKLVRKRLKNEFKPLTSFNIAIPSKLVNLIHQCLEANAHKRPKDIKDVLTKLEEIHKSITDKDPEGLISSYAHGETVQEDVDIPQKRQFNWKTGAVAVILLCVVGLSAFLIATNSSKKEQRLQLSEKKVQTQKQIQNKSAKVQKTVKQASQQGEKDVPVAKQGIVHQAKRVEVTKPGVAAGKEGTVIIQETGNREAGPDVKPKANVKRKTKKSITVKKVPKNFLVKFFKKYNTSDYLVVMREEDFIKNYDNVLKVYNSLTPKQAGTKEVNLYRHRAIVGTQGNSRAYYDNTNINDGEFYLSKAKFLYEKKQYQRALWLLENIKTTPAVLMKKKTLRREMLFYIAKCNTGFFDSNPTLERQKSALQSWFDVKSEFRNNQGHPYFIEANRKIREISKKGL
ncbi:serine/threonine-protein kinase [Fibrobacterota bacterium]